MLLSATTNVCLAPDISLLAMASHSSPVLSCSSCQMFSYASSSFTEAGTCVKCSVVLALEARLSQLEERICSIEHESSHNAKANIAGVERSSLALAAGPASSSLPSALPEQPGKQGWVTVRGKHSRKKSTGHHHSTSQASVSVSNRFAPLSRTLTEKDTLVIGSSIVRHVNLGQPTATVSCLPGARAGDIESQLKLMAKSKRRFKRIVIHCGGNDVRLRKSEVLKVNVESVCTYARTISDEVIFSGPLPNVISDEMFSRVSSFNRWLSRWCPDNSVGFIDNWNSFWGKPGLIRRDGIHPTLDGAALLSRNIVKSLASTS